MNGVINGNELLLYVDGKPIEAAISPVLLITDEYETGLDLTITGTTDYTFTGSGIDEIMNSDEYRIANIWRQIQSLPRKKKKRIKRLLEKGYTMSVTIR